MAAKTDLFQIVTDRLVGAIESAVANGTRLPWQKPWKSAGNGFGVLPCNAETGRPYRGINTLVLWAAGYSDPRWFTYRTAERIGRQIRKGEKSTPIVFWSKSEKETKAGEKREFWFMRSFNVFNWAQSDGEEPTTPPVDAEPERETANRIASLDRIVDATAIGIQYGCRQAAYNLTMDQIFMPNAESFDSAAGFYGTMFHEIGHATGHPTRLDRDMRSSYAKEELVAELTAAFVLAAQGYGHENMDNSAAYLQHWLTGAKADPKFLYESAKAAGDAAAWILGAGLERAAGRGVRNFGSAAGEDRTCHRRGTVA